MVQNQGVSGVWTVGILIHIVDLKQIPNAEIGPEVILKPSRIM